MKIVSKAEHSPLALQDYRHPGIALLAAAHDELHILRHADPKSAEEKLP